MIQLPTFSEEDLARVPTLGPDGRPIPVLPKVETAADLVTEDEDGFYPHFRAPRLAAAHVPLLMKIDLAEGDVSGFSINGWKNGSQQLDPNDWLGRGYDGVRFVGKGMGKTHIRQDSWDSVTIGVRNHNGIVQFEDCSIYCGGPDKGRAVHFGTKKRGILLRWSFRAIGVRFVAEEPNGHAWLLFTYQASLVLKGCVFVGFGLNEHCMYMHGLGPAGAQIEYCIFESAGAQHIKNRSDAHECDWAGPQLAINIMRCEFRNWYQPWTWRGGAAIVCEGSGAHIQVLDSVFRPGEGHHVASASTRSKCIMVSAEGYSYDIFTGRIGGGSESSGNGYVLVQHCAMEASGDGPSSYQDEIINTGTWGGGQNATAGYLLRRCGVYGKHMIAKINGGNAPYWGIEECNTPEVAKYCREKYGMAAAVEASFFNDGVKAISEGRLLGAA